MISHQIVALKKYRSNEEIRLYLMLPHPLQCSEVHTPQFDRVYAPTDVAEQLYVENHLW